jgi:hypothetical protein
MLFIMLHIKLKLGGKKIIYIYITKSHVKMEDQIEI